MSMTAMVSPELMTQVGDGVALPGHDLGDHAVTSTFTEGPMVVLM